jgi:hypothetical protein
MRLMEAQWVSECSIIRQRDLPRFSPYPPYQLIVVSMLVSILDGQRSLADSSHPYKGNDGGHGFRGAERLGQLIEEKSSPREPRISVYWDVPSLGRASWE